MGSLSSRHNPRRRAHQPPHVRDEGIEVTLCFCADTAPCTCCSGARKASGPRRGHLAGKGLMPGAGGDPRADLHGPGWSSGLPGSECPSWAVISEPRSSITRSAIDCSARALGGEVRGGRVRRSSELGAWTGPAMPLAIPSHPPAQAAARDPGSPWNPLGTLTLLPHH